MAGLGIQITVDANGVLTSSSYVSGSTELVIPRNVVEIKTSALNDIKSVITSVFIPNTVTKIYYNSSIPLFKFVAGQLSQLVSIIFEDDIILNDQTNRVYSNPIIKYWGASQFYGCSALTTIHFEKSNILSLGTSFATNCTSLVDIKLPKNLNYIGPYAFSNCFSLTQIIIPETVERIGTGAFQVCSSLTSITIPSNVTSINADAFKECSSLTSITLKRTSSLGLTGLGSNCFFSTGFTETNYQSVTNMCIMGYTKNDLIATGIPTNVVNKALLDAFFIFSDINKTTVIGSYPSINVSGIEIVIPETVTSIGSIAFQGCIYLNSITISSSVTSIGSSAFQGCIYLTSITFLGSSVTSIDSSAFQDCINLTSITIPSSVTSIGSSAFQGCSNLTSITYLGSSVTSINSSAFQDCINLTSITIPSSVTSIGSSAFRGCIYLNSITYLGSSVTSIGSSAFQGCTYLTSITIPSSVTSIDSSAFERCTYLTSVIIQRTGIPLTILGTNCFLEAGLTETTVSTMYVLGYSMDSLIIAGIPSNVVNIAINVFLDTFFIYNSNKTSITGYINTVIITGIEILIPSSVKSIGDSAFSGLTSLTRIKFLGSTFIASSAFLGCTALASITIPSSVTSIASSAFSGCTALTSITFLGSSVTSIDASAFSGCTALASITIPSSVTSIDASAFQGCSALVSITLQRIKSQSQDLTTLGTDCFLSAGFTVTNYQSVREMFKMGYTNDNLITAGIATNVVELATADGITIDVINGVVTSSFYQAGTTVLVIPDTVTRIGTNAFNIASVKTALTSVTIPSSVTSIDDSAFQGCYLLTSITIPSSVTSIGANAFQGCTALTNVTLQRISTSSQELTTLGSNCFLNTGITTTCILTLYNQGYTRYNLIKSGIPTNIVDQVIATQDGQVNITLYYYNADYFG